MLMNLRDVRKQTGQGIVEYALLLAFILGIAIAMQGSGIDNAIANTFARVAHALGVETEQDTWATADANDLLKDTGSSAARTAADQNYLTQIGKNLLNKNWTQSELESELAVGKNYTTNNNGKNEILLGTFKEEMVNGELTRSFITKRNNNSDPNSTSLFNFTDGKYESSRRYFYSNYALTNATNPQTGYLGVKAKNFVYTDGVLTSVDIALNPNRGGQGANLWVTVTK